MNTLAYGLLSLISLTPCTGYDLTQRIQLFWNANHSQIYPLLAKLEENGLVRHEVVAQSDKPDKKIYSITETGRNTLRVWLGEPTDPPVTRDEFTLKLFSIGLTDRDNLLQLLKEREAWLTAKLERLDRRTEEVRKLETVNRGNTGPIVWPSPLYGVSILIEKAKATSRADLEWCRSIQASLQESLVE